MPDYVLMHGLSDPHASASLPACLDGAQGWTPPTVEEVARLLPDYEVLSLIGRGGMGAVYLALQTALDRSVAIKLLPLEISAGEAFAQRFVREARAMARLSHPQITAVYDFGKTSAGHLYFAMEFVDGANLQAMIRGPGLDPAQALGIAAQVCEALTYAHTNGIVHRDIKPANVLVDRDGRVKVADFGIARFDEPGAAAFSTTQTGMILGTPDYMAPEQMRGARVDHRADLYSLGVMLYEMLCGEVPRGVFAPPSKRGVACGPRVDAVVNQSMQQDPALRYQSAAEMQAALEAARLRLSDVAPIKSASLRVTALAVVAIALSGAAWFFLQPKKPATSLQRDAAPAAPAPAVVADFDPAYTRATAEWVFTVGDKESHVVVRIPETGGEIWAHSRQELPPGDWDIIQVWLDRAKAPADLPPATSKDFVTHTSGLKHLQRFFTRMIPLADADFAFLADNSDLRVVTIQAVPVTDAVLTHLAGLKKLIEITITDTPKFTGHGLNALACLPVLEQVHLYYTGFDSKAATALSACPRLRIALIGFSALDDAGLHALLPCTSLQSLYLERTAITDAGFAELAALPKLKKLAIINTPISDEAVAAFRAAKPDCEVLR